MIVVIDVSGVVEILLHKEKAAKFNKTLQGATLRVAPNLYISELTNVFWKYNTAKMRTKDECIKYIKKGIGLIDRFIDSKEIWEEALSEGINNRHSIYDMLYMVTARRNNGVLITNDSELAAICKKNRVQLCY
ncbi:MAG: type II toxin-antitoxin system VapC family toxin [Treponema sp.]|nr:type II toxin-antitoxin system VapC family toxin [Treponema sp.]